MVGVEGGVAWSGMGGKVAMDVTIKGAFEVIKKFWILVVVIIMESTCDKIAQNYTCR